MITGVEVEPAVPTDVGAVHRLRREVEDWLAAKGVRQWSPGAVSRRDIARQIGGGEWHVVRGPTGVILAGLRVLWEDREFWGADSTPAAYVHGVMVGRRVAGRGMGEAVLRWAAEHARTRGAEVLRLDCDEANVALCSFYRGQGFDAVGRRDFPGRGFSVILFERRIDAQPHRDARASAET